MRRRRFQTDRLELRPHTARDWPKWRAAATQTLPAVTRWDTPPLPPEKINREVFDDMLARHARGAAEDRHYVYGIRRREDQAALGSVDLFVLCRDDRQVANLGYLLNRRFRGSGYAAEAVLGALEVGFSHLKLQRIEASIDPDNEASVRVAERAGMRPEGLKRGYLYEDGKWLDQLVFVANPRDLGLESTAPYEAPRKT